MSSFITIKSIGLTNLNNAEFLAFMKGALSLLPTASEEEEERPGGLSLLSTTAETGVPALGLTAEFVSAMQADVEALAEVVSESRIAQETEESEVQDKRRDMTATYVTQLITNASKSPIAAESEAGNALYKVIKPYVGLAKLPGAQETVMIEGLLADLRKEENATHIAALRLETYLTELEAANNAYRAITSQRLQARAANRKESGATIRARLGEKYEDLALLAQSYNIVQPTAETETYVNNLNQLITETTTAYNQRAKRPKSESSASEGEEGGERPGEL